MWDLASDTRPLGSLMVIAPQIGRGGCPQMGTNFRQIVGFRGRCVRGPAGSAARSVGQAGSQTGPLYGSLCQAGVWDSRSCLKEIWRPRKRETLFPLLESTLACDPVTDPGHRLWFQQSRQSWPSGSVPRSRRCLRRWQSGCDRACPPPARGPGSGPDHRLW